MLHVVSGAMGMIEVTTTLASQRYGAGSSPPLVALAAVEGASARIVSTYGVFSHTTDEPGHLACGVRYLQGYVCDSYEHAPLARASPSPWVPTSAAPGRCSCRDTPQDGLAILAVDYTRFLALARCGVLPFFWIWRAVLFIGGAPDMFGAAVAVHKRTILHPGASGLSARRTGQRRTWRRPAVSPLRFWHG